MWYVRESKYCDCALKQFEAGGPAVFVAYRAVIEFGPLFARVVASTA